MTIEQIQRLKDARPFRPFVLYLADGRNARVAHPELLYGSGKGRTVIVCEKVNRYRVIDLLLVTETEVEGDYHGN